MHLNVPRAPPGKFLSNHPIASDHDSFSSCLSFTRKWSSSAIQSNHFLEKLGSIAASSVPDEDTVFLRRPRVRLFAMRWQLCLMEERGGTEHPQTARTGRRCAETFWGGLDPESDCFLLMNLFGFTVKWPMPCFFSLLCIHLSIMSSKPCFILMFDLYRGTLASIM